ncbi:MAG: biopolymer transporter ExbD [Deltaproteobacteria bacterium]|nr:biopolymer transporter ExbD [Deltaproteobacteria bacterium]
MRNSRRRINDAPLLAEINIIPLVDVMLVLLVAFIVAAPLLQMGIDVNLPQVKAKSLAASEEKIILTIKESGEIHLGKTLVSMENLRETLKSLRAERGNDEVFLRADSNVPYGLVAKAMGEVRQAGIGRMAMITEEPRGK